MVGFLAQATINGLAWLAPAAVPVATPPASVEAPTAFLAPATINGLAYLAPPLVPRDTTVPFLPSTNMVGGSARRATTTTVGIKSSPPAPSVRYHGRAYEQEELAAAAELDDEETILAFLMEITLT